MLRPSGALIAYVLPVATCPAGVQVMWTQGSELTSFKAVIEMIPMIDTEYPVHCYIHTLETASLLCAYLDHFNGNAIDEHIRILPYLPYLPYH